jgi:methyl-accepting chemotaxis protein
MRIGTRLQLIETKLILAFGVCLFFVLLLGGLGIYEFKHITARSKQVIEKDAKIVENAQRMRANINLMRSYEKDVCINIADAARVEECRNKWGATMEVARKRMGELTKLEKEPQDLERLAKIGKNLDLYAAGFNKVADRIKAGAVTTTIDAGNSMTEFKEATSQADQMITDYAAANDQVMERVKSDLDKDAAKVTSMMSVIMIVSLVIMLVTVVVLVRSIKNPMTAMYDMIKDIAQGEGDLTRRLDDSGRDEFASIAGKFNLFTEKLRDIISQVTQTATQVASASSQLQATASQIAIGAEQVACQTSTVATASEEMAATSSSIAHSCISAADNSNQANESASTSAYIAMETVNVMNAIAERVKGSAQTVSGLGQRSDQIGEIVSTIEDIADQTNLLALNAAIEAARAGEQGRGFAVVADEVRALAERTTKATQEIGKMIKTIQSETRCAVVAMEEGVQEVENGISETARSSESLCQIMDQIASLTDQINQVATAAEEQTATTNEITGNIQQMMGIVQQTSRSAEETAGAASDLSRQAEELQRLMGQFKL